MKNIKKLIFATVSVVLMTCALQACHTVQGAGQDVADTGNTITNAAAAATP